MSEQTDSLQGIKTCSKCGRTKPLSEFNIRRDTGKYRNECKACRYKARQDTGECCNFTIIKDRLRGGFTFKLQSLDYFNIPEWVGG